MASDPEIKRETIDTANVGAGMQRPNLAGAIFRRRGRRRKKGK